MTYQPQPEDERLRRSAVYLDSVRVIAAQSDPVQNKLHLRGNLPTPCHELRVKVPDPDPKQRIKIEIYSVVDPTLVCPQMLRPFEASIDLGTKAGSPFTILVNNRPLDEFGNE